MVFTLASFLFIVLFWPRRVLTALLGLFYLRHVVLAAPLHVET